MNIGDIWFGVLIAALILFGGTVIICGSRGFMEIVTLVTHLGRDDDDETEDETGAADSQTAPEQ